MGNSCIYEGIVRHRRKTPAENAFRFPTFMFYIDLAELDHLFDRRWMWSTRRFSYGWFRRSDYLKEFDAGVDLRECVLKLLKGSNISSDVGSIGLLTQLRYLGFRMTPVSFFYCFAKDDDQLVAIVVEVNNTPWNEQHIYVIDAVAEAKETDTESQRPDASERRTVVRAEKVEKAFHVSPFMEMAMHYRMLFTLPGRKIGVKMENFVDDRKVFDVSLQMRRFPISAWQLFRVAVKFPFHSVTVFLGIYFQALKLYLKRVPVVPHP